MREESRISSERRNARTRDSFKETPRGRIVMTRRFLIHVMPGVRIVSGAAAEHRCWMTHRPTRVFELCPAHPRALGGGRFRRRASARARPLFSRASRPSAPRDARLGPRPGFGLVRRGIRRERVDFRGGCGFVRGRRGGGGEDHVRRVPGDEGSRRRAHRHRAVVGGDGGQGRGTRERARGPHPRTPRFFGSGSPARAGLPIVRAPIRHAHPPPPHALASPIPLRSRFAHPRPSPPPSRRKSSPPPAAAPPPTAPTPAARPCSSSRSAISTSSRSAASSTSSNPATRPTPARSLRRSRTSSATYATTGASSA